jgi:rhodanese-related sulfurtransferase
MRSLHQTVVVCTAALLTLAVPGSPARPAVARAHTDAVLQATGSGNDRLTVDQVVRLVRQGAVVLVDVRDAQAFERAHLPGAVSVPLAELAARADELRGMGKPIVIYCCGRGWGLDSAQAVGVLRGLGVEDVHSIAGGFERWVEAGFVVEVPPSA